MAGHFIDLAVFLGEAQPPAFLLGVVVLDIERHDRADARKRISHHRDDGAIPQAHYR
jgi:hypothetical protein